MSGDDVVVIDGVGKTVYLGPGRDIVVVNVSEGDRGMNRFMDWNPDEDELRYEGTFSQVTFNGNLSLVYDLNNGVSVAGVAVGSTFDNGWF